MAWNKINTYLKKAYGAEHFDVQLFNEWLKGKNIVSWSTENNCNVRKYLLTGIDRVDKLHHHSSKPPYIDHASFFKSTDPFKVWLVYQPYMRVDEIKSEVDEWANKNNLLVEFYPKSQSWYNKGGTSMVVITTE